MRAFVYVSTIIVCAGLIGWVFFVQGGTEPKGDQEAGGELPVSAVSGSTDSVEWVAGHYQELNSMTTEPVFVNPELARLCIGASKSMVENAKEEHGPHAHSMVRIYMNDTAKSSFDGNGKSYPEGSVIVKVKERLPYWDKSTDQRENILIENGVGGMIKRSAGFDPDHGDWEYFYFEDPSEIESGRIKNCVQCHHHARETDYVYGSWKDAPGF